MKAKNRKKRLDARIADYEAIRGTDVNSKKKKVNKSEFTKPGSLNR